MTNMVTAVEFIINSMEKKLASGRAIDSFDVEFFKTHLRNYEDFQTVKAITFGMDLARNKVIRNDKYDSVLTQFYAETILK